MTVDGQVVGRIGRGLVVLLGVEQGDSVHDERYLADRICEFRIFEDEDGKMNRSVQEIRGAMLVVSQFTLVADCRKGRRPSFTQAAPPDVAEPLYETFVASAGVRGIEIATGRFRAHMDVSLINDGPVTFIIDSRRQQEN